MTFIDGAIKPKLVDQKIYDKVLKLYNDKDYTVSEACKKIDISTAKYYKICKTLRLALVELNVQAKQLF